MEGLGTVDVQDGTGDATLVSAVGARLAAAGGTVGAVTPTGATLSAVLYPSSAAAPAEALAAALGLTGAAQPGSVSRITVVLGTEDAARVACTG